MVAKLLTLLNKEAYKLKGEVMIFELCQCVQSFLHEHNNPPDTIETKRTESFYDTMLKNRQLQDQRMQDESNEKERRLQEQLQSDILRRREQLIKENRMRRNTVSESSPHHLSSSNSEDSRNVNGDCGEHRGSETIYIPTSGRKIQTSACLGHSQKGCIYYSGVDLATGKLLFITEWTIKNSQIEAKGYNVEEVIDTIEKRISDLSKLRHKNLIGYEGVLCLKKKDYIQIFLLQEFLLGISIFSISERIGWCPEGASMVRTSRMKFSPFL